MSDIKPGDRVKIYGKKTATVEAVDSDVACLRSDADGLLRLYGLEYLTLVPPKIAEPGVGKVVMADDLQAAIDAIPDGARVRWTREGTMSVDARREFHHMRQMSDFPLIYVEQVTPSDDEVCASLLPDERITFDCEGETHTHWTYEDVGGLWAGPYIVRQSSGARLNGITNIRRVQP